MNYAAYLLNAFSLYRGDDEAKNSQKSKNGYLDVMELFQQNLRIQILICGIKLEKYKHDNRSFDRRVAKKSCKKFDFNPDDANRKVDLSFMR